MKLTATQIARHLGVSLVVADRVEGLINGRIDPDNFRSLMPYLEGTLGGPPRYRAILRAIACLLYADGVENYLDPDGPSRNYTCVRFDDPSLPTVLYWHQTKEFVLTSMADVHAVFDMEQCPSLCSLPSPTA